MARANSGAFVVVWKTALEDVPAVVPPLPAQRHALGAGFHRYEVP